MICVAKRQVSSFHERREKRDTNPKANRSRPFVFRYLQVDAHRQKVRLVCQLDGCPRDAIVATANREPGVESRAIHPAPRGAAGHVEQHREKSEEQIDARQSIAAESGQVSTPATSVQHR